MLESTGSVLVVSTDDTVRHTCRGWLRAEGLDVHEARSGVEALEFHRSHRCALTISDVRLPECNGIELMRRIQQLDAGAQVALFGGGTGPDMSAAAMEAGAVDFIPNPLQRPRLIDLTKMVMARRSQPASRTGLADRHADFHGIIAESEPMRRVLALAAQVAPLDCTVLVNFPQHLLPGRVKEFQLDSQFGGLLVDVCA